MEVTFTAATNRLVDAYERILERLVGELQERDLETQGHTFRVTGMAVRLAEAMGFRDETLLNVRRGALLHDIGKLDLPDFILHKEGHLNEAEMTLVRRHPHNAYDTLKKYDLPAQALEIPYSHHEKWDGTGYPQRLKGEEIPLSARLFAVVDVFDAMTSDRSYRAALAREEAVRYLKFQRGRHFDPAIVDLFLSQIDEA
jgi:putative nucleotidyltransferase with HDIG domain